MDDRRAGQKTLEYLANLGVRFAEVGTDKKPVRKGWQDEDIKPADSEDVYSRGNALVSILKDACLVVVDVDDLSEPLASQIVEVATDHGAFRCDSKKGVHFYFHLDADMASLLGNKVRAKMRASKRKNAKPLGDILSDYAVAYRRVSGQVKRVAECGNLYDLISHGKQAPSLKAGKIYLDVLGKLKQAQQGERNATMFRCLHELGRRLSACGSGHMARECLDKLHKEYAKINPDDAGSFTSERLDEISKSKGTAPEDDTRDYVRVAVEAYLATHDDHVLLAGGGRSDEDRTAYEWDAVNNEWTQRYLGQIDENGKESVVSTLCTLFSSFVEDATGEPPTENAVAKAERVIVSRLKRDLLRSSPQSLFDLPREGVTKALLDDGKVLVVRPTERVVELDNQNKPEDYLLATMGEVDEQASEPWHRFLHEIFSDDAELVGFFGRLVASAFVATADPVFAVCHGAGANGKSVLLSTLALAMQDHAVECTPAAFSEANHDNDPKRQLAERSRMVGKRFAVCVESNSDPLDLAFIKSMTSSEPVAVGGLYRNSEYVRLHCLPIVATNDLPRLRNVSHAVRRRVVLIPFAETFGQGGRPADPYLPLTLQRELPRIRGWMINEVRRFVEGGCKLDVPARLLDLSDSYLESQSHPIESMLGEWLEFLPQGKGSMVLGRKKGEGREAVYTGALALAMWAHQSMNMQSKKPSQKQVKQWLAKREIVSDARGRLNCQPSPILSSLMETESDAPAMDLLMASRQRSAIAPEPVDEPEDFSFQ